MRVVDCQVHLQSRTFFEAHVGRSDHPFAERNGDGYVFRGLNGESTVIPERFYDAEVQLGELDSHGVDVAVSSMGPFTVDHLPRRQATELAMHLNEERAALERRFPGRFYALALLPMQDAQAAIETLEHAIRALALRGASISAGGPGNWIASASRAPILQRIAELGVPLFLESTAGPMVKRMLDDHPALTVAYRQPGQSLPCLVASRSAAPDRLLFASDYPHGSPAEGLDAVREAVPADELDAVLSKNAVALLGLS